MRLPWRKAQTQLLDSRKEARDGGAVLALERPQCVGQSESRAGNEHRFEDGVVFRKIVYE